MSLADRQNPNTRGNRMEPNNKNYRGRKEDDDSDSGTNASQVVETESDESTSVAPGSVTQIPDLDNLRLKSKRLSGAARKRLKTMLKEGRKYEEALNIVLEKRETNKTTSTTTEKRNRSMDESPKEQAKKKQRVTDYAEAIKSIKVAVALQNFPSAYLSGEQLAKIEAAIMDGVDNLPRNGLKIRVLACSRKPVYLTITCADAESKEWLCRTVT